MSVLPVDLETVDVDPLCQKLLHSRRAHVTKTVVRVIDHSLAERAKPQSNHHAVIEDLGGHIGLADVVLQVAHEQKVASREEAVVQGVVRNVAKHRARTGAVVSVLVNRHAK